MLNSSRQLCTFYSNAEDAEHLFNARHLQFVDGPLRSIFADSADIPSVNHGLRAAGCVEAGRCGQTTGHVPPVQVCQSGGYLRLVCVALHSDLAVLGQTARPLHGETRILSVEVFAAPGHRDAPAVDPEPRPRPLSIFDLTASA